MVLLSVLKMVSINLSIIIIAHPKLRSLSPAVKYFDCVALLYRGVCAVVRLIYNTGTAIVRVLDRW
jgi:hypothetical protein